LERIDRISRLKSTFARSALLAAPMVHNTPPRKTNKRYRNIVERMSQRGRRDAWAGCRLSGNFRIPKRDSICPVLHDSFSDPFRTTSRTKNWAQKFGKFRPGFLPKLQSISRRPLSACPKSSKTHQKLTKAHHEARFAHQPLTTHSTAVRVITSTYINTYKIRFPDSRNFNPPKLPKINFAARQ